MAELTRIVLAGEGGQGVQTVAEILAEAANEEGKQALYIPNFGVEQRGGVSVAYVQISDRQIGAPKFQIGDIVVALSDRAVHRTKKYVGPQTTFVYDSIIQGLEGDLPQNAGEVLPLPAIEVAKKEFHPRVFNIIILGAVVGISGVISLDQAKAAVEKRLGYKFAKQPELRELNFRALERGAGMVVRRAG
ncbi:MAG TPA: 2-oxoacid:acceptor oxidoreductase family protein [Bacillota bacterium]|jgi:2-oxoglutarate ferredoxin oxidoreductase subunit gamma|nr:2-oxoacid:acceptor oxidoreductase family protein [Peptococcaceae bacterium MAG4]NLW38375.1 ketoisovalerate oxidoreductase [Peptococcaceae bacterium]HPU36207.1 2-oxoacid:acceptor oxidoreductase family protein [Bacillota bacterium]HPZ44214.1 2-oxoacid:acceptor oxidoreductase family protein [Bacillota bacterium]HQD76812.1 2-oxoacid:acceptor oxidoreductase family protein [Bacillota bacterium]